MQTIILYSYCAGCLGSAAVLTYYSWKQDREGIVAGEKRNGVEQSIISIFQEHRRRYGVRRIVAALKANAVKAGVYKVRKVLKEHGLKAIQPRSFVPKTTDSRHPYAISPNLLQEHPLPCRPDVKYGYR